MVATLQDHSARMSDRIAVNGTSVAVESMGDGAPIVFSHGLLWNSTMFAAQVARLSPRFRCITYDHRGQGESPSSPTPYDMETLTDDAAELIVKLGAAPCHFVGLSMGGFVGMRLATRRPDLIRSLVLIATAADVEPFWNRPKYQALMALERAVGIRPLSKMGLRIMCGGALVRDPARQAERDAAVAIMTTLTGSRLRAALNAVITRRAIADELSRISVPTLVLHGDDDHAVRMPRARAMADAIPGARFVVVPRAGHSSTFEEPEFVSRAIDAFVSDVG